MREADLSDVSQRRIITDSYDFVNYEMNRYKKEDARRICDYEIIGEDLYLVKLTDNRVGDHYPGACKKNRKYDAAKEYPRHEKEKGNITVTLKGQDLECVKRTIRLINNCVYEEGGIISDYNNKLLTALLGENWEKEYFIGAIYIPEEK